MRSRLSQPTESSHEFARNTGWLAFVDRENDAGHAFFKALAWTYRGLDDEMHRFELPAD
ncbi:hypothetical protein [Kaistia adipata]|uniref:hypothetical protein n=1 Tax=Kaistia adipata TaxID=166954 RepID=UPI0004041504|nr:hypothetical protein [Kaistia adipata]